MANIDQYQPIRAPVRSVRPGQPRPPTIQTFPGLPQGSVDAFNEGTVAGMAQIDAAYAAQIAATSAGIPSSAAARQAAQDRLTFGLEGIGLDRATLETQRADLELQRQTAGLNRRDALEAAVNNALQRGIFRSGIRARNEARVEERADIIDEGLNVAEQRLDISGQRIDLSEKELRASVKNALAAINEQQRAARERVNAARQQIAAQADIDRWRFEMERRQQRDAVIAEAGGIAPPSYVIAQPGGIQ